ncbi:hypothetical protein BG006_001778 [Podila minutissima]|uniref:Uncharacterized protein n=1 Tax=Podila minutissima TaxID=64525 RepID=A0A9P5SRB1_9FUNG|nr:hypothetical protein BG006_001778 [Podila minutissima]
MKFIATLAVASSSVVALASADMLQIHNPTVGTVWKVDTPSYLGWTGSCSSMGAAGKAVMVDLMTGPSGALRFVTNVGIIDCTGSNSRADITVPKDVESGKYSLTIRTSPDVSYTNQFDIVGAAAPTTVPSPKPSVPSDTNANASSSLGVSPLVAVLGAAVTVALL